MNPVFEIEIGATLVVIAFILWGYLVNKKTQATVTQEIKQEGKPLVTKAEETAETEVKETEAEIRGEVQEVAPAVEEEIKTTVEDHQPEASWSSLLKKDIEQIWGDHGVRIFESNDGNILYVPVKDVENWTPEEIVFWILGHEDEVYQALKKGTADIDLLKKWEDFTKNLTTAKVLVEFRNLNVIPSYHTALQCWKLVLEEVPEAEQIVKNIIVEEIK